MVHKQALFGIPFLCLAFGAASSCKTVPQGDQVKTAGELRIDVFKTKNDKKRKRFDANVRIWNDYDARISFELANVVLLYNGREVSAKPADRPDPKADVQMRSSCEFHWFFEFGEEARPGKYEVQIRDIQMGDLPLGQIAVFTING